MIAIETFENEFGEIKILRSLTTGSFIYRQAGACQTEIDLNGVSLVSYVHAIYGLLLQTEARNVLMVGCGGGSLGTMLARVGVRVTIVDNNPASFRIARDYFKLPEAIDCHVADGEEFLHTTQNCYDAIVMDAYKGIYVPRHLSTKNFFRLAQSHLDQTSGRFFANVFTLHDLDRAPDQYAAALRSIWKDVRLLDTRGAVDRNALVVAGDVRGLQKPSLVMQPLSHSEEIAMSLDRMNFRSWRH